jgi:hypothetical protein
MCDERERLIGYVYDECEPAERRAIEAHLDECGTCRAEIGALRNVRQDLVAWSVPPHDTIWRPLVAVPTLPWWRQVPAWAMAAAAGVMFLAGAAGGVVTHALVPHQTVSTVATAPTLQMVPAGVTANQLTEVEQRMVQLMRDELSKRQAAVGVPVTARVMPASIASGLTPARLDEILTTSEQKQWEFVRDVQNDFTRQMKQLRGELGSVKEQVFLMQSGGGR